VSVLAQLAAAAVGLWLMAAPAVLAYGDPARTSDRIVGPLIASVAIVAASEVTRGVRWANLPLAFWLLAVPWILGYETRAALNGTGAGLAVAALACVPGRTRNRFGGGWASLLRDRPSGAEDPRPE
jgi:hypothetical protein